MFLSKRCLFRKCLSTFHFLLFANFSLQNKHTGKPVLSGMKANEFVHEALSVPCASDTLLFLDLLLVG